MNDEQRIAKLKKDYEALKVEHGVASNELATLKKELQKIEGVKSLKELQKLLEKLEKDLVTLEKKRDNKFEYIENQLMQYKR
jgi:predicted  nucleic acid-binding Zn-ribbon protein